MMRLTHDNKVFSPGDVRWIGRIEIGSVDGRIGNPFRVQHRRFLTRKGKGVRREHGTLAQISPWLIKYIGEGEIDVVLAAANPQSVTMKGVCSLRDGIVVRDFCSRMAAGEGIGNC